MERLGYKRRFIITSLTFEIIGLNRLISDFMYFTLFANCILVKGATQSTICDLQINRYIFIPNTPLFTRTCRPFAVKTKYEVKVKPITTQGH